MPAIDEFNTPAPKHAIMLPEVGQYAHVWFSFKALLAIEEAMGERYSVAFIFDQLDAMNASLIQLIAGHALHKCSLDQALEAMTIGDLAKRIADALSSTFYGRTVEQEMAKRQADALAHMERVTKLREAVEVKNNG